MSHYLQQLRAASLLAISNQLSGPGRATYMALTISVTVAAWLALAAVASPFLELDSSAASDKGVTVRNARSPQQMLPLRYAANLASLSDVHDVVYNDLALFRARAALP